MVGSKLDACANYHVSPFVFIVTRQLTDRRENVVVDISITIGLLQQTVT